MSEHALNFLLETEIISKKIRKEDIDKVTEIVFQTKKKKGRIFFLGLGGSAANCSHAVNDFRKIANIECYTPTDNAAELTARINDEGWESVFVNWLKQSNLKENDIIFILSVGGGNLEKKISINLVAAIDFCKENNVKVVGIVSRDGGYTKTKADACIMIPVVSDENLTPHAESWQAIVWHLIVTDPRIKSNSNKWESIDK
jgi:D-sedoheptulose 7-phosphate isomerase|tara:strand:+ start:605 stop:1207 length:603 start_codon:yes stop_codon:yes gene_type:complete